MRSVLTNILLIFLAIALGAGVAVYRIANWSKEDATLVNGVWQANKEMNLGEDKLLTARIAIAALFALKTSETIYMVADKDNEGNPLTADNDYIITGHPVKARYWSITMYGDDYFLVPNEADRFSYNMSNVDYQTDSSFTINVSATKKSQNWLPAGDGQFYLLLRMYHPSKEVYEHLETVYLPDIQKVK